MGRKSQERFSLAQPEHQGAQFQSRDSALHVVERKASKEYNATVPRSLPTDHPLLQLQRQYGNHFVQRIVHQFPQTIHDGRKPFIQRRVRPNYVSCGRYPTTYPIFSVMGTDDPVGVITAADTRAIQMLDSVIGELEYTQSQIRGGEPAAAPTINDTLAVSLRNRFAIDPENSEVWTSGRHRTSSGSATITLLLTRLRSVRRILAGGWIRYTCISSECEVDDWAWAYVGEYRIYLCRHFWSAGAENQALTLLHEAFHIYFTHTDSGQHMWNGHCIEQFVADFNGVTIPAGFEGSCS